MQVVGFTSVYTYLFIYSRLDYLGFESQQLHEMFLLSRTSRPALGPRQSPIFLMVNGPSREEDYLPPPSRVTFKKDWR